VRGACSTGFSGLPVRLCHANNTWGPITGACIGMLAPAPSRQTTSVPLAQSLCVCVRGGGHSQLPGRDVQRRGVARDGGGSHGGGQLHGGPDIDQCRRQYRPPSCACVQQQWHLGGRHLHHLCRHVSALARSPACGSSHPLNLFVCINNNPPVACPAVVTVEGVAFPQTVQSRTATGVCPAGTVPNGGVAPTRACITGGTWAVAVLGNCTCTCAHNRLSTHRGDARTQTHWGVFLDVFVAPLASSCAVPLIVTLPPTGVLSVTPDRVLTVTAQVSVAAGCFAGTATQPSVQWALAGVTPMWTPATSVPAIATALTTTALTLFLPRNTCAAGEAPGGAGHRHMLTWTSGLRGGQACAGHVCHCRQCIAGDCARRGAGQCARADHPDGGTAAPRPPPHAPRLSLARACGRRPRHRWYDAGARSRCVLQTDQGAGGGRPHSVSVDQPQSRTAGCDRRERDVCVAVHRRLARCHRRATVCDRAQPAIVGLVRRIRHWQSDTGAY
jgi:hypothetical protein